MLNHLSPSFLIFRWGGLSVYRYNLLSSSYISTCNRYMHPLFSYLIIFYDGSVWIIHHLYPITYIYRFINQLNWVMLIYHLAFFLPFDLILMDRLIATFLCIISVFFILLFKSLFFIHEFCFFLVCKWLWFSMFVHQSLLIVIYFTNDSVITS